MPESVYPRIAKRLPCAVRVEGRRYSGVVLNVSQGGLFIQTNASPRRGEQVVLELNAPEAQRSIPVQGEVRWRRAVPPALRSAARGGVGVKIQHADESYYVLLARWMRSELPVAQLAPAPAREPSAATARESTSWRVRVRALSGPRTRTLSIEAPDLETARTEALRYAGEGWRVIAVEAL